MLVLRTSNFQGATIRPIVPRNKHSIVFIVIVVYCSSETKPRVKLDLVSRKPLLYLESVNKPNKQNVSEINLFLKNSTFPSLKISVDTLIDDQE